MELQLSAAAMGLVPVIMAITSASKQYVGAKWSPLIALAISLAASFLVPTADITTTIIQGVVMGLMASGLYSSGKTTLGAVRGK